MSDILTDPCECSGYGHCPRFNRTMNRRDHELCSLKCPEDRPHAQDNCTTEIQLGKRQLWVMQMNGEIQRRQGPCGDKPCSQENPPVGQPPRQESAHAPGFIKRARNFSMAYRRWVAAGKPLTPPDELEKRRAICKACEQRDPQSNMCLMCGCPLEEVGTLVRMVSDAPSKLEMATETCPYTTDGKRDGPPAPKWLPVVPAPCADCHSPEDRPSAQNA